VKRGASEPPLLRKKFVQVVSGDAPGYFWKLRADPVGVFAPHKVRVHYLGWNGDGHINRVNITHSFYWVLGKDDLNPIAGEPQNINAQMFAAEVSYDRDWMRFRTSYFFASATMEFALYPPFS
jgi:hypothetical protein